MGVTVEISYTGDLHCVATHGPTDPGERTQVGLQLEFEEKIGVPKGI